jgi:hypothetical protein
LFVGAKIDILGRKTTLMQVRNEKQSSRCCISFDHWHQANLVTGQWLEYHAKRLSKIKVRQSCFSPKLSAIAWFQKNISEELRKYDKNWAGEVDKSDGRAEPSRYAQKKGGRCLRVVMNAIVELRGRLGEFRPALAQKLAGHV